MTPEEYFSTQRVLFPLPDNTGPAGTGRTYGVLTPFGWFVHEYGWDAVGAEGREWNRLRPAFGKTLAELEQIRQGAPTALRFCKDTYVDRVREALGVPPHEGAPEF